MTVQQLKEKLVTHISIPADNMRLVYSGRVLKDEDMVDLYGVKEGHTIHVVRGAANRAAEQAANVTPTTTPTQRNVNGTATNSFGINHFGTSFEQDMRNMMNSPVIRALEEMGFVDQAANIRALLATGGDVNSAIEFLLAHR
ncbi:13594_t:CDS:2, partial [Racocetra fulgida]